MILQNMKFVPKCFPKIKFYFFFCLLSIIKMHFEWPISSTVCFEYLLQKDQCLKTSCFSKPKLSF